MKSKHRLLTTINVVPYIDVMLVLVIVLMTTTPLLQQSVHVDLPSTHAKKISYKTDLPLIVTIDKHGYYYLNLSKQPNKPISKKRLLIRLMAEMRLSTLKNYKRHILIQADQNTAYNKVVQLIALLQNMHINQVELLTKPLK